jgi:hypothetical protein
VTAHGHPVDVDIPCFIAECTHIHRSV